MEEVHMVVRIAKRYQQLRLDFCIITFYDPQRAAIIKALENADLPLECVYNVDSFQGMCHSPHISIALPDQAA
jgi:regulator of nonsense transcripts 1